MNTIAFGISKVEIKILVFEKLNRPSGKSEGRRFDLVDKIED
jgi:hypothetical protein